MALWMRPSSMRGGAATVSRLRDDPIDAATAAASVSQDNVIVAALSWLALPANLQASAHIETRLVLFTDENRYRLDSAGNKQPEICRPSQTASTPP
jgi:hypothetical protein